MQFYSSSLLFRSGLVANPIRLEGGTGSGHQFSDRFEYNTKLIIIFLFQFIKATSEVCVRGKHRSEAHKRSHDGNVHFDSSFAVENAGEHRHTLLGEGEWWCASATAALCSCILQ